MRRQGWQRQGAGPCRVDPVWGARFSPPPAGGGGHDSAPQRSRTPLPAPLPASTAARAAAAPSGPTRSADVCGARAAGAGAQRLVRGGRRGRR
eukprot:4016283-Pyramimonas_sp.AAC.1